jgi:phage recombination protein Bet
MNAPAELKGTDLKASTTRISDQERSVAYRPAGASEEMTLTVAYVKNFLTKPTKQGFMPSDAHVIRFMMLCKASHLNPWQGDAYLIGYDSEDGPVFDLITAIQALLKRAELSPEFDGMESGVVIQEGMEIKERKGTILLPGEKLLGGWARCFRKDRGIPFYQSVQFCVYDTGRARWKKDPAGMIVKCARASVLREAFPNSLAGLYVDEEMESVVNPDPQKPVSAYREESESAKSLDEFTNQLRAKNASVVQPASTSKEPENPLILGLLSELQTASTLQAIESIEADFNSIREQLSGEETQSLQSAISLRKGSLA